MRIPDAVDVSMVLYMTNYTYIESAMNCIIKSMIEISNCYCTTLFGRYASQKYVVVFSPSF